MRTGAARKPQKLPRRRKSYHHGDLRAALLKAAEAEIADKGVHGFTLRACARRAGVSHAAPAHHFHDVTALLTEMAIIGFEGLTASMCKWRAAAASSSRAQFVACGRGYIDFALNNPQHFLLMFGGADLDKTSAQLESASDAAFGQLLEVVGAVMGLDDPLSHRSGRVNLIRAWSVVHGFAKLRVETGGLKHLMAIGTPEEDADIDELLDSAASTLLIGGIPLPDHRRYPT